MLSTTAPVTLATPESESLAEKLTVTLVLFHPFVFGAGVITGEMSGGVASILTGADTVVELPA